MKKLFLILFAAIWVVACKKDDDAPQPQEPPIPIESRYLSKVADEDGQTIFLFEYNADKTLKTIATSSGELQLRYEYENANISRVYFTIEGETFITDFVYENGAMVSFMQENVVTPVLYSAADNSYSFTLGSSDYQFFFNDQKDVEKILQESEDENFELNFFYEPKFGSLHNINSMILQTYLSTQLSFYLYFRGYNFGYQPMESFIATEEGTVNYENTYDELNGLIESEITTIDNGETTVYTVKYEYIQL